jgi:hypothetical protein
VEGLARIRQANTRRGRYSREQVELARLMREHQMNFTERAMAMRGSMRDHFLRVARSGVVPPTILEQMREMVRADIAQQDQQRLRDKGLGFL